MDARYRIRSAQPADVPAVCAIEGAVFSDPWSARDFRECAASGVPFLIAEQDGIVAGYAVAHHAADEGEILNLGVAPSHQRRGVGRVLVERLMTLLADRGVHTVYLEVRESNAAARGLYQQLGFREVGRRPGYYRRPPEDAVVLRSAVAAETGRA